MAATTAPAPPIRLLGWGDDLRLPSFTHAAATDTAPLLTEIAEYRKTTQPFQSRHLAALKRSQWFALHRPACRSRTGLLVLWPAKSLCVFVAPEETSGLSRAPYAHRKAAPHAPATGLALLRLRVDPQFYAPDAGLTIFAATLSASSRRLWIEDVLLWKGRAVTATESFTARWALAAQWLEHYCIVDEKLVGGLRLEMARWQALDAVHPEGVWEFLADAPGSRRLLWIARASDRTPTVGPEAAPVAALSALEGEDQIELVPAAPTLASAPVPAPSAAATTGGPLVAIATRESGGPDQWALSSADGVSLGRALVRRLAVSSALRTASGKVHRVEVIWAATFNKWEVTGVCTGTASHSTAFKAAQNAGTQ
jgi:hypothetical protein